MEYAAQVLQAAGYCVTRTALADAQEHAAKGRILIGGGLPEMLGGFDYLKDEAFLYDNARLTAEGALVLLGSSTDGALFGADVAVIGMGRIAECLCPLLRAVGACVTVYARRPEVLSRARAMGTQAVRLLGALPAVAAQHQIVCNTVPHVLCDRALLSCARRDVLLLELASAPGGFDRAAAEALGLQMINGQGLPGKYAPRAAGQRIAAFVLDAILEEGKV